MKLIPVYNSSHSLVKSILFCHKYAVKNNLPRFCFRKKTVRNHRFCSLITTFAAHRLRSTFEDLPLPYPNGVIVHLNTLVEVIRLCSK